MNSVLRLKPEKGQGFLQDWEYFLWWKYSNFQIPHLQGAPFCYWYPCWGQSRDELSCDSNFWGMWLVFYQGCFFVIVMWWLVSILLWVWLVERHIAYIGVQSSLCVYLICGFIINYARILQLCEVFAFIFHQHDACFQGLIIYLFQPFKLLMDLKYDWKCAIHGLQSKLLLRALFCSYFPHFLLFGFYSIFFECCCSTLPHWRLKFVCNSKPNKFPCEWN